MSEFLRWFSGKGEFHPPIQVHVISACSRYKLHLVVFSALKDQFLTSLKTYQKRGEIIWLYFQPLDISFHQA